MKHLLAILFGFFAFFQPLQLLAGDGFTMYVTTNAQNRYGGNIMLDVGHLTPNELPDLFSEFDQANGNSLLPPGDEPIEVIIVVPKGASLESRRVFADKITAKVTARYPNMKLAITESFVDLEADRNALEAQEKQIEDLMEKLPKDSPERELLERADDMVEEGLEENKKLKHAWFHRALGAVNSTHPYNTIIAARIVALGKFVSSGAVIVSKYGLNPASLAIGALAGGISAAFGYNAKKYSNFCTSHKFPWFQDFMPVRWYNKTGWFKSATINLFRSLGISYILRGAAYATGQTIQNENGEREIVGTPNSLEFLFGGLGLTIPEIWLDGLMDDGARALEMKGIFNHQSRSYLLWTVGFIDTIMHAFFRAGAVEAAYGVAVVSWSAKAATWALGRFMPSAPRRLVFVSDGVSSQKTAELHESRRNFFTWLATLGTSLAESILKRAQGKFTVDDKTLVRWHLGLDEAWNLALSPEQRSRIDNDPTLTASDFVSWLNLRDADREVVRALWQVRNENMGKGIGMATLCAQAFAGPPEVSEAADLSSGAGEGKP